MLGKVAAGLDFYAQRSGDLSLGVCYGRTKRTVQGTTESLLEDVRGFEMSPHPNARTIRPNPDYLSM